MALRQPFLYLFICRSDFSTFFLWLITSFSVSQKKRKEGGKNIWIKTAHRPFSRLVRQLAMHKSSCQNHTIQNFHLATQLHSWTSHRECEQVHISARSVESIHSCMSEMVNAKQMHDKVVYRLHWNATWPQIPHLYNYCSCTHKWMALMRDLSKKEDENKCRLLFIFSRPHSSCFFSSVSLNADLKICLPL